MCEFELLKRPQMLNWMKVCTLTGPHACFDVNTVSLVFLFWRRTDLQPQRVSSPSINDPMKSVQLPCSSWRKSFPQHNSATTMYQSEYGLFLVMCSVCFVSYITFSHLAKKVNFCSHPARPLLSQLCSLKSLNGTFICLSPSHCRLRRPINFQSIGTPTWAMDLRCSSRVTAGLLAASASNALLAKIWQFSWTGLYWYIHYCAIYCLLITGTLLLKPFG